MNLEQAKAVQQHIDLNLAREPIPFGFAFEDNSELAWILWDEAKVVQDFHLPEE